MRRVVLAIQVRIAHLRSLGKGANKTPLDLAAWPPRLQRGERPVRPPPPGGGLRVGPGASAAPARRKQPAQVGCGRTDGQERTAHV